MKHKLDKIKKKIKNIFVKEVSLGRGLRKIIGRKTYEQISAGNTDWRILPQEAGDKVGISVNEILQKVADYYHLPFITRVPSIDSSVLPANITFGDLKRLACIPRINNGVVTAYICLDPKRARMIFGGNSGLPFAIASWGSIQNALKESESALVAQILEREQTNAQKAVEAAKQALHLVISQVKKYSIEKLNVDFSKQDRIAYTFNTKENKSAEGDVHNRVRDGLYALLNEYSGHESVLMQLSSIAEHKLSVTKDLNETLFSILLSENEIKVPLAPNVYTFPTEINQIKLENSNITPEILIVDDNQIFAKVLEKFLGKLNVKIFFATNGKEAIERISSGKYKPDIVICDLHMPEMNGSEFVKRIREELKLTELPVIILTSDDSVETELLLLTEGADSFIAKSEDPRLLCVKIEKMLQKVINRRAA